jgi:anti-anti-sigma factor
VEVAYFGELDRAVIREAEQALRAAMAGDATVVVDLSGLSFMDASGLRMLLAAHARLRDRLVLLRPCPSVHRLFEVTGTAGCLPFAD